MKCELLKNSALASLAVALALTALPAQAQDSGHWRNRGDRAADHQAQRPSGDGQAMRGAGASWRSEGRAQPQARVAPAPTAPQQAAPQQQAPQVARGGRGDGGWRADRQAERGAERRSDGQGERRDWSQRRDGDQRQDWRSRDSGRSNTWSQNRDRWRDTGRDGNHDRTQDRAAGYRDGRRDAYRDGRHETYRQWNHGWRNDRRYDWHRYRNSHRSTYNVGVYYSPYRSYSYRRLGVGFYLGSLFYSNRYWVNDPWQYRLPEVYGPYRWVRYYDDVLLVDIYSGEVVDVIHDFFW